jgi:ADP-heptose:LPS heptosyltransferase
MAPSRKIRKILLPRFDTLGDIVLLEPFLRTLHKVFDRAEITILVRERYGQLATLFPNQLKWQVTGVNPSSRPIDPISVKDLLTRLENEQWDLVLFTKYEWTWLEHLIGVRLKGVRRVATSPSREVPKWLNRYFRHSEIDLQFYDELVTVEEKIHETEKYQILLNYMAGGKISLPNPKLIVPDQIKEDSRAILQALGLVQKKFLVCLPGGTEQIDIKRWPTEKFAKMITWLKNKYKIETLLVGNENERAIVEEVASLATTKGYPPSIWLGKQGEIPLLAGLLEQAKFYFGNDTGPMHMSAALGVPVVALFGGGTWPRFLPKGSESHAIVRPMPCFHCGWKCSFGDAPCIKDLPISLVQEALETVVRKDKFGRSGVNIHEVKGYSEIANEFIKKAGETFRIIEADREARLEAIHELGQRLDACEIDNGARLEAINELGMKLDACEVNSAARLEAIQELGMNLDASEANSAARLEAIQELGMNLDASEANSAARLEAIHKLGMNLDASEANSAARLEIIQVLSKKLQVSEGNRSTCLALIEQQKNEIKSLAEELEQLRNNLELMKLSRSWRITAPLRWIHNQWNNIFGKLGFT